MKDEEYWKIDDNRFLGIILCDGVRFADYPIIRWIETVQEVLDNLNCR